MDHWADYVVFVLFLAVSLSIGVYHALRGGRQRTTQEFIMADRQLKILPTTMSMLVSHQSAIMIIGFSAEMYTQGTQAWLMGLVGAIMAVLMAERLILPWMYPLKLTSVYEYFELRYRHKALRIFTAVLGLLFAILYMGVAIYAPSVALETATGFPAVASIPLMAVVCVAYTALGGMKAVVWTDVFQFVVIFAGMLGVLIKGAITVGGLPKALDSADDEGRLIWGDFSPDPTVRHTVWGFLIGYSTNWGHAYAFSQPSVQRYSAVTSLTDARLVLLLNIPILVLLVSISCMIGIVVVGYYAQMECDPLVSGLISSPNQILPQFVKTVFKDIHGFSGLFIATLYSGALSSVSSSLSGAAANAWQDIMSIKLGHLTEHKAALVTRITVLFVGVIATGVAFLSALLPGPITQVSLAFLGSVGGPMVGMFLISGIKLFRWVDWKGVLTGGVIATLLNFWISFGSISVKNKYPSLPPLSVRGCEPAINVTAPSIPPIVGFDRFYSLSYLWYVPLGIIVTMVVGLLVSAIIYFTCRSDKSDIDLEPLFIPFSQICSFKEQKGTDDGKQNGIPDTKKVSLRKKISSSEGRISITGSSDKFTILDVSTISDGSYTQYNPPIITSETNI